MSSPDFFPSDVRPAGHSALRWSRIRPQGWNAATFHGVYEIRPSPRLHRNKVCWQRGDGFKVLYQRAGDAEHSHLAGVTTWFPSIANAKDAVGFHHHELLARNCAPRSRQRRRPSHRVVAARAELRAAIARRNALVQPALPLRSPEE